MHLRTVWGLLAVAAATIAAFSFVACGEEPVEKGGQAAARFVGGDTCARCHQLERELWSGSDHDLAMQEATEETVLGDFDGAEFTHFGVTSTFSRKDGRFILRTDGPDGELQDYEIKYVFGVDPLQQYLVEFPGGRLQVSSLCWDSRPAEEGGQRWFHIYGDEEIPHDDVLHWTGPNQNWNFMCAECHSTDLHKGYDLASDSYRTTWSEIDVSCEACHGPGSEHVTWAEGLEGGGSTNAGMMGLQVSLKDLNGGTWVFDPGERIARRTTPRASRSQIEACARCHSRRSVIQREYAHGRPLMDTHMPALLEERLYHADGQILEEVYVYGSFLQSKMYRMGVTCSDCHEPHGLNLIASGNSLCGRCHEPAAYDTPEHHFHKEGSPGARCVECHMPARTYMVVDPRRDHSMRIPRPDLSVKIGTPSACIGCHEDQSDQWAADAVREWYPPASDAPPHYAMALDAGRSHRAGAGRALASLISDEEAPGIVRASALALIDPHGSTALRTIASGVGDPDPLVRRGALLAMDEIGAEARLALAFPLLQDPVRGVRIEAARTLSPSRSLMTRNQQDVLDRTAEEFIEAQLANGERAGSHLNLGVHYLQTGRFSEAESSYRTAIRLDPDFLESYVNLADLYQQMNRDDEGEPLLREALRREPGFSSAHHALGLLLVRTGRKSEALSSLRTATNLDPANSRFAYVYASGLYDLEQPEEAMRVLREAHRRNTGDPDILRALVSMSYEQGHRAEAVQYARILVTLDPDNQDYQRMLAELLRDG